MTLLHQIKTKTITDNNAVFEIPCGVFKEKPRTPHQMAHFCIFPETQLWEFEKFIRFCAALKYSHIVLEFWGMLRYDCLKELGWSFAYSKKQIRSLNKTANELGLEIIPMFNHWGQIELCGEGKYFHLGCDEAYNFEMTTENYTVLTDYLNGISAELAEYGRRTIIWGDMLVSNHDSFNKNNGYAAFCKGEELEKCLLQEIDRRIIIADWQYGVKEAPVETALIFKEAGFDTLLCPWDRTDGDSVTPCVETAAEYGLYGVMQTTWQTLLTGMPDVARAAYHIWGTDGQSEPPHSFFDTNAAKIIRKVYPVNGDYEKAGWAKRQTGDMIR